MIDDNELVERIRARAYRLWEEDGRPEGREVEHWDKARILVAIEVDRTSLIPVAPDRSEDALQANLGDFPSAMTGEGDREQTPLQPAQREILENAPLPGTKRPGRRNRNSKT